jgi:hypothetical protein
VNESPPVNWHLTWAGTIALATAGATVAVANVAHTEAAGLWSVGFMLLAGLLAIVAAYFPWRWWWMGGAALSFLVSLFVAISVNDGGSKVEARAPSTTTHSTSGTSSPSRESGSSTSTTTTKQPPAPRPLGPPASATIGQGQSRDFFGGQLLVGVGDVYDTWANLTISTSTPPGCTLNESPNVGTRLYVRDGETGYAYAVAVTGVEFQKSVAVRVQQLIGDPRNPLPC